MATFLIQQQEIALRLRFDLTNTDQLALIKRWLNRSQKEIWSADDWNFSLDRQTLQTVADATAGTVSIGVSGSVVTGVSTAFGSNHVGQYIQFSSSSDWYKITAVDSTTSLTVEVPYTATTALSAGTYTIRKMFYSLGATVEQILSARQTISPSPVDLVDFRDFDIFRPNPTSTGNPQLMILFGQDSSNNLQVGLYPTPSAIENIEIRFKKLPIDLSSDSDVSLIPAQWAESVMIDGALAQGYDFLSNGNAALISQGRDMYQKFQRGIELMKVQHRPDAGKHQVIQSRDVINEPYGPRLPNKYGVG